METEVKILMAVVGVCQGFVNGTEGLSEGMRGMGVGGGEGYGMMPNQGYAKGEFTRFHPLSGVHPRSTYSNSTLILIISPSHHQQLPE